MTEYTNYNELLKLYKENERFNNHSENAVLLADTFGEIWERDEVRRINRLQIRQGYLTPDQVETQYALSGKYYKILLSLNKKASLN